MEEWRAKKLRTEEGWVEVLEHLEAEHMPYAEFAIIIEFVLCLPGYAYFRMLKIIGRQTAQRFKYQLFVQFCL